MKLSSLVKEIPITEMQGLRIGNAQDFEAMTGVTVLIFDEGAKVGTDISGGGPASRETPLTSPITADNPINAIVLSGGSAFVSLQATESCSISRSMRSDMRLDLQKFRSSSVVHLRSRNRTF